MSVCENHRYTRNGYRTNTDLRPENRRQDRRGRTWLKCGPYSNTVRGDHPIVQHVNSMGIPCNACCLNRRRADSPTRPMGPHRDSTNSGKSWIAFWGDFPEGEGALVCEDGRRYETKRHFHACGDLSTVTHWVEDHSVGTRYSCVAFTGAPPRLARNREERVGNPSCRTEVSDHRKAPPEHDGRPTQPRSEHTAES